MRPCRWMGAAALAVAMMAMGTGARAEDAAPAADETITPVPLGTTYTLEANLTGMMVKHAYFAADDADYEWGEGFARVRLNHALPTGWWFSVGGVGMATAGTDYYEHDDEADGMLDQLAVGFVDPNGSGLSAVVGRQDLQVGDGFVIGDGYLDRKAALWSIPLNFYDAVRVDWERGPWHALGFGANLSRSFDLDTPDFGGKLFGGEVGWSEGEDGDALAVGFFTRTDDTDLEYEPRAVSLRCAYGFGPARLAGEAVFESGTVGDVDFAGRAGHLGVTVADEKWKFAPHASLEYLLFTGDDPETADKDEAYSRWQYRWNDWSKWYVADLMASTLVFNSDARIWKLECGMTPREGTGLRLLAHRIDLDTGASFGGLPAGIGRGFADEVDLVVDQSFGEHWSAWVMGAYAMPRDAAKELIGDENAMQVFGSVTFKFGGSLGAKD